MPVPVEIRVSPRFPALTLGAEGYLAYEESFGEFCECNLLSLVDRFYEQVEVFDSHGQHWTVSEVVAPYHVNAWTRLLAHTFFNPRLHVRLHWNDPSPYTFADLQQRICDAVDQDDEVLTQFVDARELTRLVRHSVDFEDLVRQLRTKALL